MPKYSYSAKSLKGEEKNGVLEVKDEHFLAMILKEQGFLLISAKQENVAPKRNLEISIPFFKNVSLSEKLIFTRNLQVMISSGLPLPRSLDILATQTKNGTFKKALFDIKENIVKGENFSERLKYHPRIFSDLFQNMVKVGEESGTLDQSLQVLSRHLEREYDLQAKIKGAMMYPAVIIFAMTGIGFAMLILVVPKLAAVFEELGVQLPLTTRLIIGFGNFLANNWLLVIIAMIAFIFSFLQFLKFRSVKKITDGLFLKVPVLSSLITKINTAYTARTLGSLVASGVPLIRSLEITAGVLGNFYFKSALLETVDKVRKGSKLSDAFLEHQNIYPVVLCQMMQVGEETGETSNILAKLAEFFENEVAEATKNLTAIIEPILMLVIGGVVGFFAISMVQPMYSMLGSV